jgi:hypothetical protein
MRFRTTRAGFDIDSDFDVEASDDVWIDALGNDARLGAANIVRILSGTSVMYPTVWEGQGDLADFTGTWDTNTLTIVVPNGPTTLSTLLDYYDTNAPIWIKTADGYVETDNSEAVIKTVGETTTTFEIPTSAASPTANATVLRLKLYDSINSLGEGGHNWIFEKNGKLSFPSGGAIEPVGMGWMGVTNGISGNPVSILNKNLDGYQRSIVSLYNSDTYGTAEILTVNAPGIPNGLSNWDGSAGGWDENIYTNHPTTGGTGTGLTVNVAANGEGYISIGAITISNPGAGYISGDVITITNENNLSGTFTISVPEQYNAWTFDEDGSLTLPSVVWNYEPATYTAILVTYGETRLTFTVLPDNTITNMSVAVGVGGYGPDSVDLTIPGTTFPGGTSPANDIVFNVQTFESAGPVYSTDPTSAVAYVSGTLPQRYDSISSIGGVSIGVGDSEGANTHHWTFGDNGNLTLPEGGDVVNITGVSQTAQRAEGSWTLPDDTTDTYSFTLPSAGTYTMWVKGNIPNGIITWNATVSISNTNVPAIGSQYAWNYTGGGSPIEFISIPNQIRGTAGAISTDATYAGTTSNRFDFEISNTSGSNQTVYWGYTKI